MTGTDSVSILPDTAIDVGQFVGANADDGAEFVMKGGQDLVLGAADAAYVERETCDGVEFGAGESFQGTLVEIVKALVDNFCYDL